MAAQRHSRMFQAGIHAFTDMASAFRTAGFVEVARRSETRPIMRYEIVPPRTRRGTKNKT
jgi:hypothetical protein